MNLRDAFPESHLLVDLRARDKKAAIREVVQFLVSSGATPEEVGKKIERAVNKREAEGSTGIGKGIAIPHAKDCAFLDDVLAVLARSTEGIDFDSIDGEPVHLIFLVVSPVDHADKHLAIMRKISMMHRDEKTLKFFMATDRVPSVLEIFREIDESFH